MFGLSEAHYNLCKQAARRCSADLQAAINEGKPKAKEKAKRYNELSAQFIAKHHAPIATLMDKYKFMWLIGHLNDRFGHDDGEYE